jgi:hypothetical protein
MRRATRVIRVCGVVESFIYQSGELPARPIAFFPLMPK